MGGDGEEDMVDFISVSFNLLKEKNRPNGLAFNTWGGDANEANLLDAAADILRVYPYATLTFSAWVTEVRTQPDLETASPFVASTSTGRMPYCTAIYTYRVEEVIVVDEFAPVRRENRAVLIYNNLKDGGEEIEPIELIGETEEELEDRLAEIDSMFGARLHSCRILRSSYTSP